MKTVLMAALVALMILPATITTHQSLELTEHERVVNRLVMTVTEKYKQDYSIVLQVVEAADNASKVFDLPRELILAVIATESSFNPMATSRLGAQGLMQIHHTSGLTPTYDIHENIMVASGFLKGLIERKGVEGALSHYNAGYKGSRTYPKKVLAKVEQFI